MANTEIITNAGTEVAGGNTETPASKSNPKARAWCFTSYVGKVPIDKMMATYFIQGTEICPTSKREHIQGYVYFKNARYLSGLKKEFDKTIHWEIAKGTPKHNYDYCSKDKNFETFGELPAQGKRTELKDFCGKIEEGFNDKELVDHGMAHMILKFHKGLDRLRATCMLMKRNWPMDIRIYWGAAGTGKTRSVYDEFGIDNIYTKMDGRWWDGYNGETCVLFDDFDPSEHFNLAYDYFLKLFDRYPMIVEFKGGSCQFCSKTIIITSNHDPSNWWNWVKDKSAWNRRITTIKSF